MADNSAPPPPLDLLSDNPPEYPCETKTSAVAPDAAEKPATAPTADATDGSKPEAESKVVVVKLRKSLPTKKLANGQAALRGTASLVNDAVSIATTTGYMELITKLCSRLSARRLIPTSDAPIHPNLYMLFHLHHISKDSQFGSLQVDGHSWEDIRRLLFEQDGLYLDFYYVVATDQSETLQDKAKTSEHETLMANDKNDKGCILQ